MSSPRVANSMGFVSLPDLESVNHKNYPNLKTGYYKGIWNGSQVFVPYWNGDDREREAVFEVDSVQETPQTCNVFVQGKTAVVQKTYNQNYSGDFSSDGKLIVYDLK